jgi:hypothetical protein
VRGIRVDAEAPLDRRETLRTINEVADELYFVRELAPGDGLVGLVAGTAVAAVFDPQTVPGTPSVEFPATAGGKPAWRVILRRRSRWQRAGLRLHIEHTATAGAAGNVRLELLLRAWSAGDALPGRTDLGAGWTFASATFASTVTRLEYVTTTIVIPGDKDWISFFLYRDKTNAADTSGFPLYVTGIKLEVLPQ